MRITPKNSKSGFTYMELMIVVSVISVVSGIAFPAFMSARTTAQISRFVVDAKTHRDAFVLYAFEKRGYPPEASVGLIPVGMEAYLEKTEWTRNSPLGGQWDFELDKAGSVACILVKSALGTEGDFIRVDEKIDDGNLSTGDFRSVDSGYMLVIE